MPQVARLLIRPYPSYLPLALVCEFRKRYGQCCVNNHYKYTLPHSVAWNRVFKDHKKPKGKLRRKLDRCWRKCSKWLPTALEGTSHLQRNRCETHWSSSAETEAIIFHNPILMTLSYNTSCSGIVEFPAGWAVALSCWKSPYCLSSNNCSKNSYMFLTYRSEFTVLW
jgi:hypothetical protein